MLEGELNRIAGLIRKKLKLNEVKNVIQFCNIPFEGASCQGTGYDHY